MRNIAATSLLAIASALIAPRGHANEPCVPPFCVQVQTPNVRVQPPPVRVEAPPIDVPARAEARARAEAEARARVDAEIETRRQAWASWRAYWKWDAELRAAAEARIAAELSARLHAELGTTADRYAFVAPPITPPPSYPGLEVPMVALSFVPLCTGMWSGSRAPIMLGFCTNLRVRITRELSVTIDPSLEWVWHERTADATLAMSPGVTYSFLTGEGRMANSHSFASAGLDAWVPLAGFRANPDLFGGAHVGLGATTVSGRVGVTAEVRGLVRGGIGARGAAEPEERSSLRLGFEARMSVAVGF